MKDSMFCKWGCPLMITLIIQRIKGVSVLREHQINNEMGCSYSRRNSRGRFGTRIYPGKIAFVDAACTITSMDRWMVSK
jgi:hypothetical protein